MKYNNQRDIGMDGHISKRLMVMRTVGVVQVF